uniref:Uncharacterized protein n=1 Tax=Syphacia muris TaxID=451379 RepID=A0A0N5ANE3_9BILA
MGYWLTELLIDKVQRLLRRAMLKIIGSIYITSSEPIAAPKIFVAVTYADLHCIMLVIHVSIWHCDLSSKKGYFPGGDAGFDLNKQR